MESFLVAFLCIGGPEGAEDMTTFCSSSTKLPSAFAADEKGGTPPLLVTPSSLSSGSSAAVIYSIFAFSFFSIRAYAIFDFISCIASLSAAYFYFFSIRAYAIFDFISFIVSLSAAFFYNFSSRAYEIFYLISFIVSLTAGTFSYRSTDCSSCSFGAVSAS